MSRRATPDSEDDTQNATGGPSTLSHTQNGTSPRRKKPRMSLQEAYTKQSMEEKQKIGRGYRDLQSRAEGLKTDLANTTAGDLTRQLTAGKKLFANVRDTNTAAIDARHFSTTLDAAMSVARKMNLDSNQFNVDDFLHRIRGIIGLDRAELHDIDDEGEEDELDESAGRDRRGERGRKGLLGDWEKVGWMAAGFCRRVPGLEVMYGPIDTDYKKRVVAQRAGKKQLAPEKRAQEIETAAQMKDKVDDTTTNVLTVFKVLRALDPHQKGVNLFELIVNPDDFGQTVENLFYVSFLIKDGRITIDVKDDGLILISWQDQPDGYESQEKRQEVLELTMEAWRSAKEIYNITKSEIPHRNYEHILQAVSANGWK